MSIHILPNLTGTHNFIQEILDLNIKNASQTLDFHPTVEMHIIELLKLLKKMALRQIGLMSPNIEIKQL